MTSSTKLWRGPNTKAAAKQKEWILLRGKNRIWLGLQSSEGWMQKNLMPQTKVTVLNSRNENIANVGILAL